MRVHIVQLLAIVYYHIEYTYIQMSIRFLKRALSRKICEKVLGTFCRSNLQEKRVIHLNSLSSLPACLKHSVKCSDLVPWQRVVVECLCSSAERLAQSSEVAPCVLYEVHKGGCQCLSLRVYDVCTRNCIVNILFSHMPVTVQLVCTTTVKQLAHWPKQATAQTVPLER
jgi:hypothetical protein